MKALAKLSNSPDDFFISNPQKVILSCEPGITSTISDHNNDDILNKNPNNILFPSVIKSITIDGNTINNTPEITNQYCQINSKQKCKLFQMVSLQTINNNNDN